VLRQSGTELTLTITRVGIGKVALLSFQVSAVFVKSIAVIYNGYAVAATLWEVELAFCTVHTVAFRATWAVFPYSIVALCWLGLASRANIIFKGDPSEAAKGKRVNTVPPP